MAEAAAQLQKGLDQLALLPETPERQREELEFWSALGAVLRAVKGQAAPETGQACRFLDDGWAGKAAAFGWGPLDLFGCNREHPFPRIDRVGLLWLLNGNRLLALSEITAAIETPVGVRWMVRRSSDGPDHLVLPWETET